MKQMVLFAGMFLFFTGCCDLSHASSAIQVHVAVGKVSEVAFPQKIAKVIKGGMPDSVLVEVLDRSVYLLPKTNSPADIFVTLASGESYPLSLKISAEHDVRVDVDGHVLERIPGAAKVDAMDLMKVVLRGIEPAGATLLKGGQEISFDRSGIRIIVERIYDLPHLAAYILKASNQGNNSVVIPLQQVSFPNLLAIASDQDMLLAKGQDGDATNVYMIVGK